MKRIAARLTKDDCGAVAPTVALSLFALIACGGVAFDYAHMAGLDTELQDAADQAALAAATQLDGGTDARLRATAAASSLLRNSALFAERSTGPTGDQSRVTVPTVIFYQSYDEATDVPGSAATTDAGAKVVMVTVGARKANFALTPVVGALNSGDIAASAVASLSAAVCKVPPLMICAPNRNFPTSTDIGKGVLLEPGSGSAWVPGNYGYLDFGNGASGVKINLGKNNDVAACTDNDDGVSTEPGNKASVTKFLNTRFDLYASSVTACNSGTGDFCPAQNVRKDLTRTESVDVDGDAPNAAGVPPAGVVNPGCGAAGATSKADFVVDSAMKALPRDSNQLNCGTTNSCSKFGNGSWDREGYRAFYYPAFADVAAFAAAVGKTAATLTRWSVYQWELADKANRLKSKLINAADLPSFKEKGKSGKGTYTYTNRCAYPQPKNGTGVAASSTQKDRRLLTVAVVDCTGETGRFDAKVLRFADMFLVQPSLARSTPDATDKDQIYAEVVRVSERANGQSAFQYYLRQKPRLLK